MLVLLPLPCTLEAEAEAFMAVAALVAELDADAGPRSLPLPSSLYSCITQFVLSSLGALPL
jgi:hypothetical protein